MKPRHFGALPYQDIHRLIELGHIMNADSESDRIQPASLDLTITEKIYRLKGVALPRRNERVRDFRESLGAVRVPFDLPLEIGEVYLIKLRERLCLPDSVYGYVNPKSSTGRIDCHVRLISDGFSAFDGVCSGYEGSLWAIVIPKSFRLKLEPGMSLNQMRFFSGDTRFTQEDLERENRDNPLVWDVGMGYPVQLDRVSNPSRNGTVVLHADLSSRVVGWRARATDEVLDLSRRDVDPKLFWEPACPENDMLLLRKDEFWILSTKEGIMVPPWLAAEVVAMDERYMEARSHFAGFFDPGWGWRKEGRHGDTATMEVRPYEDMYLRDGLPLAGFRFEFLTDVPERLYGAGSNYGGQTGAGLAKFFAPFPTE